MTFHLSSPAFAYNGEIPVEHTCDGADLSPALEWRDPPARTAGFALICDDPDAPVGTWVHWVVWGIPASATGLPGGVPKTPTLSDGSRQGANDFRRTGYGGPCPPQGPAHRYFFRVYALDNLVDLEPGATRQQLLAAMKGHVLAEAELMGRYQRGKRQ